MVAAVGGGDNLVLIEVACCGDAAFHSTEVLIALGDVDNEVVVQRVEDGVDQGVHGHRDGEAVGGAEVLAVGAFPVEELVAVLGGGPHGDIIIVVNNEGGVGLGDDSAIAEGIDGDMVGSILCVAKPVKLAVHIADETAAGRAVNTDSRRDID